MIITLDNFEKVLTELTNEHKGLRQGTILQFIVDEHNMRYLVHDGYFQNKMGYNDEIFDRLDLDKYKFCTEVYGKKPTEGIFPVCPIDLDWEKEAVKMAYALFKACKEKNIPPTTLTLTEVKKSFLNDIEVEEHHRTIVEDFLDEIAGENPFDGIAEEARPVENRRVRARIRVVDDDAIPW